MNIRIVGAWLAALCMVAGPARAQAPARPLAPVRVISFDGGWNLPVWAAQRQGFFEANGVAVQTHLYAELRLPDRVAVRRQAGHRAGADGQPDRLPGGPGRGQNSPTSPTLSRSSVATAASCRWWPRRASNHSPSSKGKTLSVDALTTGAAFVLRELVAKNGLTDNDVNYVRAGGTSNRYAELLAGKHDATLLRTPFELLAQNRGFQRSGQRGNARALPGHGRIRPALVGASRTRAAVVGFLEGIPGRRGLDLPARQPRARRSAAGRQHPRHDAGAGAGNRTTCCWRSAGGSTATRVRTWPASARCWRCAANMRCRPRP